MKYSPYFYICLSALLHEPQLILRFGPLRVGTYRVPTPDLFQFLEPRFINDQETREAKNGPFFQKTGLNTQVYRWGLVSSHIEKILIIFFEFFKLDVRQVYISEIYFQFFRDI